VARGNTPPTAPGGDIDDFLASLPAVPPRTSARIRTAAEARAALRIPAGADTARLAAAGVPPEFQFKAYPVIDDDPRLVAEFAAFRILHPDGRRLRSTPPPGRRRLEPAAHWICYGSVIQAADGIVAIETLTFCPAFVGHPNRTSTNPAHTINSQLLRVFSPTSLLTNTVEQLRREGHWLEALAQQGSPSVSERQRDHLGRISTGRSAKTEVRDEALAELAKYYIVLVTYGHRRPLLQLAHTFGITREQARDRIHKAREHGYLMPSKRGRTNVALGPRLKQLGWSPPHPHPDHTAHCAVS
jgi:hypothetical protein